MESIILALIAIIPTTATVVVGAFQGRRSRKEAAKQNIRILMLHDRVMYEQNGQLPKHYEQILIEYEAYHKAGGNGVVTEELNDYRNWIKYINKKGNK